MSILIKGLTAKELLDVFEWARTGANNCMIGHGVIATELPDHGRLIDADKLMNDLGISPNCKSEEDCEGQFCAVCFRLREAPTVIEADGSEE